MNLTSKLRIRWRCDRAGVCAPHDTDDEGDLDSEKDEVGDDQANGDD